MKPIVGKNTKGGLEGITLIYEGNSQRYMEKKTYYKGMMESR